MIFWVGTTDNNWFNYLSKINPEDVNFWKPGGNVNFRAISTGSPFVFKLRKPLNAIAGLGFFSHFTKLPLSMAWEIFAERNGAPSFPVLQKMILSNRSDKGNKNPTIGCVVLSNPIFFSKEDWIPVPSNWSNNIVQGKRYFTDEIIDGNLWRLIEGKAENYLRTQEINENQLTLEEPEGRYRNTILSRIRLGQGAFRTLVTDAYNRRCSISGEKTLPVLEAAHIQSYSELGPHLVSNGILLRSDLHKLFDGGYITITQEYKVEVSRRIKEEFENGRDYYKYHGNNIQFLPKSDIDKPGLKFLDWHNNNRFNG